MYVRTAAIGVGPGGAGEVVVSCILGETIIEDLCNTGAAEESSAGEDKLLVPLAVAVGGVAVAGMGGLAAVARKQLRK